MGQVTTLKFGVFVFGVRVGSNLPHDKVKCGKGGGGKWEDLGVGGGKMGRCPKYYHNYNQLTYKKNERN